MTDPRMILAVIALLLALYAVVQLAASLKVYRGAQKRRPRNVSDERRQPPTSLAALLGALTLLGFRRLGEVELEMPDNTGLGPLLGRRRRHVGWLLVDEPQTTLAEVVEPGPALSLETWLSDGVAIQTSHPQGEDLDMPGLRASNVPTSPAEAYDHHRRMVDALSSATATPTGVHSMGDYLRHDASYRERFAERYLRGAFIRRQLLPSLLTLLLAGLVIGGALLSSPQ